MGYDISALPAIYKTEGGTPFVYKSILDAQTIKILNDFGSFDGSLKGVNTVQQMDASVTLQDGSVCGFNPVGGVNLSQATLTVKPIKVDQEYCSRDLEKTWMKSYLAKGQDYTDLAFANEIGELNAKLVSYEIEKLVWTGDTGLTASTNLKLIDGYLKQIKAGSYIGLTAAIAAGTNTADKLKKIYLAMPVEVRSRQDMRLFIGPDVFDLYTSDLADKNLFNPPTSGKVLGTNVSYEVVNGLIGGHVVAAALGNLRAGGEMTDISFESFYDNRSDSVGFKTKFSLGVVPVIVSEIGYVKLF